MCPPPKLPNGQLLTFEEAAALLVNPHAVLASVLRNPIARFESSRGTGALFLAQRPSATRIGTGQSVHRGR